MRVGNLYVNRNQIGAVVGSQPFGGEGLSGTGPKAGGPHYLARLTADLRVTFPVPADLPPAATADAVHRMRGALRPSARPLDSLNVATAGAIALAHVFANRG